MKSESNSRHAAQLFRYCGAGAPRAGNLPVIVPAGEADPVRASDRHHGLSEVALAAFAWEFQPRSTRFSKGWLWFSRRSHAREHPDVDDLPGLVNLVGFRAVDQAVVEEEDVAGLSFDHQRVFEGESPVEVFVRGAGVLHPRAMAARVDAQCPHGRGDPGDVDHPGDHRVLLHRPVNPVLVHSERADDVGFSLFVQARALQDDIRPDELFGEVEERLVQQSVGKPAGRVFLDVVCRDDAVVLCRIGPRAGPAALGNLVDNAVELLPEQADFPRRVDAARQVVSVFLEEAAGIGSHFSRCSRCHRMEGTQL